MRPSLVLAPVLLLLAGCVTPAAPLVAPHAGLAAAPDALAKAFAHAADGTLLAPANVADVLTRTLDANGAEPTIGVTKDGTLFVVAFEKVLRSKDGGATWDVVSTPLSSPTTLDPFLYVDPDTDRVYSDQLYAGCSWLSWSDDKGATWTTNPIACGLPANDHQKLVTGKDLGPLPTTGYPKVLYYAYNNIASSPATGASRVSTSYDGGLTWLLTSASVPDEEGSCNGGLHGSIVTAPDGTLYVPKRTCEGFLLAKSSDSAMTWTTKKVGADAGGSACRKNPTLGVDSSGNLYGAWPGKDNRLYLTTSQDKGATWLPKSIAASPPAVTMTTMPSLVSGDPGRIAIVYYGTADAAKGPDEAKETALWHVYVTYSTDALSANPTFTTVRVTDDPVQAGPISTNSDCKAPKGSRNLLDFLDAHATKDGRLVFTYTDGCIDACAKDPKTSDSRAAKVSIGVLEKGPSLLAGVGDIVAPLAGPQGGS